MEISRGLHMNGGEGKNSYYNNSLYQKKVILTAKPILEETIEEICGKSLPECLIMADLGCSSGPNTVLPSWEIIETIDSACTRLKKKPPTLQFFLNDLHGNDFNTIFRSVLPNFQQKLKKKKTGSKFEHCFVAAMPGSFYGRLFPSNSLHFVHSSYSLHWCSQVPKGLVSECGIQLNKDNICADKSSPASVHKAYLNQFERDFMKFLKSRSVEMVSGGGMVLTFMAKSNNNPYCKYGCEMMQLIGNSLKEMVKEGIIEESKLENFNVPLYTPSEEEVRNVIEREGSFTIKRVEEFELRWDANMEDGNGELVFNIGERGKYVADYMRAVAEPTLASHFGDAIINDLFFRLSLKVTHYLNKGMGLYHNIIFSMIKN